MDAIDRLGFNQNTLFMMVSDHGEPMGNGEHGHGLMRKVNPWPYEELVHAPMLLKAPGVKTGQRLKAFVQSCDVAPTVCDWLGIGVHPDMQGKSLLPMVFGEVEKVRDFAIAGYCKYSWAIYTDDYSYVHWVKSSGDVDMIDGFYGDNMKESSTHLDAVGARTMADISDASAAQATASNDAQAHHKESASLDGEEQWTCTPASVAEVPEKDELYDRKNDPFQLKNIIDQKPEVAKQLYDTLREFMTELSVMG